jgi:RNA polymerase sigma factor (sigma-70 family)
LAEEWLALCLLHAPELIDRAARILGSTDEAEDAFQDLCLKLLIRTPHAARPEPGYLFRAIYNTCVKRRRRLERHARHAARLRRSVVEPEPSSPEVVPIELQHTVAVALNSLRPRTRRIFLLRTEARLPRSLIAAELGVTVRIVEREMTSARARLRRELEAFRPPPAPAGGGGENRVDRGCKAPGIRSHTGCWMTRSRQPRCSMDPQLLPGRRRTRRRPRVRAPRIGWRPAIAGLALMVLTLPSHPSQAIAQTRIDLDRFRTCTSCILDVRVEKQLGDADGEGAIENEGVEVVYDAASRSYAVWRRGSGNVQLFDASGRFLRLIGRTGGGPGEIAGMGPVAMVDGTVHIMDVSGNKWVLLDARGAVLAERPLTVRSGEFRVVAVDTVVVGSMDRRPAFVGLPLHLVQVSDGPSCCTSDPRHASGDRPIPGQQPSCCPGPQPHAGCGERRRPGCCSRNGRLMDNCAV